MAVYRYRRLQQQLVEQQCAGALLCNPVNLRYATGTGYAQITHMNAPDRAAFVPAEGKAVLFDWELYAFDELSDVIGETRASSGSSYRLAGERASDLICGWSAQIVDLVKLCGGGETKLALDLAEPELILALDRAGIELVNGTRLVQRAGIIKSEDELDCIRNSIAIAEEGIARIRENLRPGISEQALWAYLAFANARYGGEWFDYRILSSGARTNPWGRECSDKLIEARELVAVDSGMVGPLGYSADVSRTFFCPPGKPSTEQRRLYRSALENLNYNVDLIRADLGFREFSLKSWPLPEEFRARRYNSLAHGVGMGNVWPFIAFADEWPDEDCDGVFEENMVIAIESCIGREDGGECVKLEDMVLVTNTGCERLSTFAFEGDL